MILLAITVTKKLDHNIVWLILSGLPLALEHVVIGGVLCITIIGIPFGLQQFKLAKLALMPFGSEVY